jgi:hypothetical protein
MRGSACGWSGEGLCMLTVPVWLLGMAMGGLAGARAH